MVHPNGVSAQCCWSGQAWSTTRNECVGIPKSCPQGYEPRGEKCQPKDSDQDGIPDLTDKCPSEPEDMNGFEDQDGCPDEPRRLLAAQRAQEAAAAARAATEAANAQRAFAEAEARAQAERRQRDEAREREIGEQKLREARAQEEHARVTKARVIGGMILGLGVASGVSTGLLVWAGGNTKADIMNGGYATGADIDSAASRVNLCTGMAVVTGIVGAGLATTGIVILAKGAGTNEVGLLPTRRGLILSGSF
jgi:hypothetical protein